ncbi:MAG: hypothetical protein H6822_03535 [Planctomycetaceae bacterium]|nr:hypothetical protein [Planctomycetales bacterium]MCB9921227.1 hypothetical protein [Planctomycetaceae bacterium]
MITSHRQRQSLVWFVTTTCLVSLIGAAFTVAGEFASHQPVRPLPQSATRPLDQSPRKYVDGQHGDDASEGTIDRAWRTLGHAVTKLEPGDTLVLRAGIYHEHVSAKLVGAAANPITIRTYPGELVTIDGGLKEFLQSPKSCWEAASGGVVGEFRSTKTYPDINDTLGQVLVSLPRLGKATSPLAIERGEILLGDASGRAALTQIPVGRGRLIYSGWSPAADLPNGQTQVTIADEERFAEQMQITTNIAVELYSAR